MLARLADFLPDYKPRPGQVQMAEAVAAAMQERKNLGVEGGTGIGKSMAYLVPALLSVVNEGAKVLVAAASESARPSRPSAPVVASLASGNVTPSSLGAEGRPATGRALRRGTAIRHAGDA